ncbi:WD40/YVTN/BNR-like repeat-containing protein [Amycolatopsis taiwanensis]|uniref:Glycosyl hydrolase n=1 Tax=Amycolatopsis taiwanensis TaxID=342230 RepID=A0A9W6VEJ9_9PSEU|nr:hypothetical protein [Amycolatopsis taiwanensis]GLY63561.1 hypothetical protein Atai01_01800 [Amycolatopsis taiwanensis]
MQTNSGEYVRASTDGADRLVVATAGQVYGSDDAGRTLISKQATGVIGSPQSPVMIRELAISPLDPDLIFAATGSWRQETLVKGGHGVLRSDDGGHTWREFSNGLSDLDISALAFAPDGHSLFALTPQSGAYRIRL